MLCTTDDNVTWRRNLALFASNRLKDVHMEYQYDIYGPSDPVTCVRIGRHARCTQARSIQTSKQFGEVSLIGYKTVRGARRSREYVRVLGGLCSNCRASDRHSNHTPGTRAEPTSPTSQTAENCFFDHQGSSNATASSSLPNADPITRIVTLRPPPAALHADKLPSLPPFQSRSFRRKHHRAEYRTHEAAAQVTSWVNYNLSWPHIRANHPRCAACGPYSPCFRSGASATYPIAKDAQLESDMSPESDEEMGALSTHRVASVPAVNEEGQSPYVVTADGRLLPAFEETHHLSLSAHVHGPRNTPGAGRTWPCWSVRPGTRTGVAQTYLQTPRNSSHMPRSKRGGTVAWHAAAFEGPAVASCSFTDDSAEECFGDADMSTSVQDTNAMDNDCGSCELANTTLPGEEDWHAVPSSTEEGPPSEASSTATMSSSRLMSEASDDAVSVKHARSVFLSPTKAARLSPPSSSRLPNSPSHSQHPRTTLPASTDTDMSSHHIVLLTQTSAPNSDVVCTSNASSGDATSPSTNHVLTVTTTPADAPVTMRPLERMEGFHPPAAARRSSNTSTDTDDKSPQLVDVLRSSNPQRSQLTDALQLLPDGGASSSSPRAPSSTTMSDGRSDGVLGEEWEIVESGVEAARNGTPSSLVQTVLQQLSRRSP